LLHESKKEDVYLHLDIPQEFFDMLTGEETMELSKITETIKMMTFAQGVDYVRKSSFYLGMSTDKKA